jgi:hypothetical protein
MPNDLLVQGAIEVGNVFQTVANAGVPLVIVNVRMCQGMDEIRGYLFNGGANPGDLLVSQGSTPGVFDVGDTFPVLAGATTKFAVPIVAKFIAVTFTSPLGTTVTGVGYLYPGK